MTSNDPASERGDWQSIALPIVLIVTGIILLGGDFAGILSLDRIQNLWPVAVIAIGAVELIPLHGGRTGLPASREESPNRNDHVRQV